MRYVTAVYYPDSGEAFQASGQAIADATGVTREYVHRVELHDDDTVAELLCVRGDETAAADALRACDRVHDVAVRNPRGGAALVYVHHDTNPRAAAMIRARRQTSVVMDMPIVVRDSGAFEVTYLGTDAAFAETFGEVPEYDVAFDVLETGEYTPTRRDAFDSLTDRQGDVVATAVELGYYRNPREATQEDVADAVGCSPGTVGEHLRKAEQRVFSQFVDCPD
ncbi:bacterio-opsin activator [Halorubellus sp. JP-L1]|uniref:helix-turn-helix domain-containing protein n=1 Tax=Halorubellus sp. JP-L1 TaxID=2715753 RepID=UPI001409FE73|nr:helix-turn-helix domain-containing protein [Halorubellus sp. JP-L1]NHN41507.1 bacterio-opsin activator [Halorubellus sp. JP-L1]